MAINTKTATKTATKTKPAIGDIVLVEGYGGLARVIEINPAPGLNYDIATVQFGPYNLQKSSKPHDFSLSKLTVHRHVNGLLPQPANNGNADQTTNIDQYTTQAQILTRLAELNQQLAGVNA
jgi:hypothetical protein